MIKYHEISLLWIFTLGGCSVALPLIGKWQVFVIIIFLIVFRHPEMGAVFILKFTWSISPTAGVQGRALCPGSTPGAPLL